MAIRWDKLTVKAQQAVERASQLAERAGDRLLRQVRTAWPDPPEWVAMFFDILQGSQLGPGEGGF